MKPYIFGHRGASGYEIENTIIAFKKAVSMKAGIESDVQLTKDNKLICFHDPIFMNGLNYYRVSSLTYKEIGEIKFKDNRKIPLVEEVFKIFKESSINLRYSFDMINKNAGLRLLNLAQDAGILENIEFTDRRFFLLSFLRKQSKKANLVYTLAEFIKTISDKTINLERLRRLNIRVMNIRCNKNQECLFKDVVDHGFKCSIWGVNTKIDMKRIIKMKYNDEIVHAIYTDYPDILINLINEHF
ncbi:MAG: glycerophosphodiester phosphodiesterase [Promethearchaeota archaeon]